MKYPDAIFTRNSAVLYFYQLRMVRNLKSIKVLKLEIIEADEVIERIEYKQ